jgi:tRNA pseudouridine32 synthase/23S rRNA pseudouridine746 synthase
LLAPLFIDDVLLVINKPSGLLSVPGKGEDKKDCMLLRIQEEFPNALLVHRLDMDTSGIMVFARSLEAQSNLSMQFEERLIKKRYVALLEGKLGMDQGEVQLPIRKDMTQSLPPRHIVDHQQGKSAYTKWSVIEFENNRTRVHLYPLTGRSHQLRVHMSEMGHPIVGDPIYGEVDERLMLHSECIVFKHPVDGRMIELESPAPF